MEHLVVTVGGQKGGTGKSTVAQGIAVEAAKGPFDEAQLQPFGTVLGIAGVHAEAHREVGELDPRGDPVVVALENRRPRAPGQELGIRLGALDQIEHALRRIRHQHGAPDVQRCLPLG